MREVRKGIKKWNQERKIMEISEKKKEREENNSVIVRKGKEGKRRERNG